ncbi:hypothetical protein K461DRAFT_279268 [Myriangium duriaei CBS 260.36]|uniref:Uncharacterized protein n=1 Tax=Myriangium duriaei CBS 260.36 TaxID=1168546 RepID=A0A9P4J1W8_9PEZI|nr:hypothetical protein K461DRAFT_279268 [Myriangium duriaei CBS 260.36]
MTGAAVIAEGRVGYGTSKRTPYEILWKHNTEPLGLILQPGGLRKIPRRSGGCGWEHESA